MKLFIQSFGCQMSVADAQEMARPLFAQGWEPAARLAEADAAVINTCTVRQHAEDRAISMIGRMATWKESDPRRLLIVSGCAAQRLGASIRKKFPHVDLVLGSKSIERYPGVLEQALRQRFAWKKEDGPLPGRSKISTYVTIMRGCDYACSYCIVPQVRGRELSRPLDSILAETREKVEAGAKEIVLLGQTVNSYRSPDNKDFADLLDALENVPGLERLRFMSPHPRHLDDRMTQAMARSSKVCRHLHLPLQSGSDPVLKAMRRNYTVDEYLRKIEGLRRAMPDIAITTDAIAGFPGETETDFKSTLDALRSIDPASTYCFKFSPRPGTPAEKLDDDVPRAVKEERLRRLLELVEARMRAHLDSWRGKRVRVLLEDGRSGRTGHLFKAILTGARPCARSNTSRTVPGEYLRQGHQLTDTDPRLEPGTDVGKPGDLVDCVVTGATKTSLLARKVLLDAGQS